MKSKLSRLLVQHVQTTKTVAFSAEVHGIGMTLRIVLQADCSFLGELGGEATAVGSWGRRGGSTSDWQFTRDARGGGAPVHPQELVDEGPPQSPCSDSGRPIGLQDPYCSGLRFGAESAAPGADSQARFRAEVVPMSDDDKKQEILKYLFNLEGKGVDTTSNIGKALGLKRKECSKLLTELEKEGKIAGAGITAGVTGYKAVK
jgi:hypothetical protein